MNVQRLSLILLRLTLQKSPFRGQITYAITTPQYYPVLNHDGTFFYGQWVAAYELPYKRH